MAILRNVAKTDTLESQRQKINQIASDVFSIGSGGSDLSTGNLKLGDGTRTVPSLAFVSDPLLGIFKPAAKTIGFVSGGKKIVDYSETKVLNYKDFILQQNILTTNSVDISNSGANYDPGIYSNINLLGGTGSGAIVSISVGSFNGSIINQGSNYTPGSYNLVPITGGSGNGATISFSVDGITGSIQNAGSGYPIGTFYGVPLTNGSGTGATADITITGTSTIAGTILSAGSGYTNNTYTGISFLNVPTSTYTLSAITNPGTPPPNQVYSINGISQQTLNLLKGNTYRFDISNSSLVGHPLIFRTSSGENLNSNYYTIIEKGIIGTPNGFIDLIIDITAPSEIITYRCSVHPNMGGIINVASGSVGVYGKSLVGEIIFSSGSATSINFTSPGQKYKANDTLQVYVGDVGGGSGSGFLYRINSVTSSGTIQTVNITSIGLNYLINDILSFNNSSVGGFGSGFQYRISSQPGKIRNLTFISKGTGYLLNDTISISETPALNISSTLRGQVLNIPATLSSSSPIITITSTLGIVAGMTVTNIGISDVGFVNTNTTVLTVDSLTQLTLSSNPLSSGLSTLNFSSVGDVTQISVTTTNNILVGSIVTVFSGSGILANNTTVTNVNTTSNIVTLSQSPTRAGNVVLNFEKPYGTPSTNFQYTITSMGSIDFATITNGGNGYSISDVLTVSSQDLTQPIKKIVTVNDVQVVTFSQTISANYFQVNDSIQYLPNGATSPLVAVIYGKTTFESNLVSLIVEPIGLANGINITKQGQTTQYTVSTAVFADRFFIDGVVSPNLTLYVGDTYEFDITDSSNTGHNFLLSQFRDGIWGPSYIQNIATTLSASSNQITVSNTTGILPGMEVTVQVSSGSGVLQISTKVSGVTNSTTLILDKIPSISGTVLLSFRGIGYSEGVEKTSSYLRIKILPTTPNLYYYCSSHENEGGGNNQESLLTVDQNNPKIFGSNFELLVSEIDSLDIIKADISTGELSAEIFTGTSADITDIVSFSTTANNLISTNLTITNIFSSTTGIINIAATTLNLNTLTNIGAVSISNTSGNITTPGILKTTNSINVNDKLTITNNTIATISNDNIVLSPASGRVAKVNSTTALVIPAGTSSERPSGAVVENGAIRFNTQTGQYEGYSASTSSWSSLGGVRDLDGNTYIAAEASIGANDNTLYFYNDANNTLKLTPYEFAFNTVKNVHSLNILAPTSTLWSANSPVTLGQYINYGFNVYEVTTAGTTGGPAVPPTHSTGAVVNGTSTLTWNSSYVDELTFSKISNVNIGTDTIPTKLIINGKLRLFDDTVSTITNDLVLYPYAGKKVTITANSSLVIPAGTTAQRGVPAQGSIRYSSTLSSFEGYNGTNWTSLGGVKDVDGNTYIIPESVPGANENILYFYNNGSNTLKLSTSGLLFDAIDTITSTNNNLDLNVNTVTFNSLAFTIDNTGATSTKLLSTRTNFDFALSSGVTADPLIRLNTTGDILINKTYSTGTDTFVKVLDNELKTFDLDDVKIETFDLVLTKGTTDLGFITIFTPSTHNGAKVVLIANNINTNDREVIEYNVVSKNTDIFHTEYGNVITGADQVNTLFDFDEAGNVRLTSTLSSALTTGNVVNITVIKTIFKK